MFKFFSRKNNKKEKKLELADINGNPLQVGELVEAMRYNLGVCEIIEAEKGVAYRSVKTGEEVHFVKMVDAVTTYQKVKKIIN